MSLSLAACALPLAALGAAWSHATTARALRPDVPSLAVGVTLVALSWYPLRLAPRTSIGARRLVATLAAIVTLAIALLHGAAVELRDAIDARYGPPFAAPWRELTASLVVFAAAAYVWATSPAVRG